MKFLAAHKRLQAKTYLWKYTLLLLGTYLFAINFHLFLKPLDIVVGGTNSVAIILEHLLHWDTTIVIAITTLTLLLVGFVFLGWKGTKPIIVASILYPLLVTLTEPIVDLVTLNYNDSLILVLFSGVLQGIATGLIFKVGFSPSGFAVLSRILYEKRKISISKSNFGINALLLSIGTLCLGMETLLYAILVLYLTTLLTDRILLGISSNKLFYIQTTRESEVKAFITAYLKRGVTTLEGWNQQGKHQTLLFTVLPTKEYFYLKEVLQEIDPQAFYVITDSYEVLGGK